MIGPYKIASWVQAFRLHSSLLTPLSFSLLPNLNSTPESSDTGAPPSCTFHLPTPYFPFTFMSHRK